MPLITKKLDQVATEMFISVFERERKKSLECNVRNI